jgi:hypothetical protein
MNTEDNLIRAFVSEINFDHQCAANAAESVTQLAFRPVANAFAANIENAVGLLQLPYSLLMWSHVETKRLLIFTDVFLPLRLKTHADYRDEEVKRRVDEEVDRRFDQLRETEEFEQELCLTSDSKLALLLRSPDIQRKMRMMLLSLISATWTAFEILAGDAWQFALNTRPDQFAQGVLRQLFPSGTPEGISAKGIPVWMAAKYGFDLRNHVGDMLKPRVDFSDIKEIQKAYLAAFGRNITLEGALADKNLLILEATRHLVVHRGGLVDEKYNKTTDQAFETNQPLPLDPTFLSNILGAGIDAGCALISAVDGWLGATHPTEPSS